MGEDETRFRDMARELLDFDRMVLGGNLPEGDVETVVSLSVSGLKLRDKLAERYKIDPFGKPGA